MAQKRRPIALLIGLVTIAIIFTTGFGGRASVSSTSASGTLAVTRLDTYTPGFGPAVQNTGDDALVNSLLFSNLVKVKPDDSTLIPDLATRWTVSPDAKTFTFYLRHGVKWSDGQPFTAADVVFTITKANQMGSTAYQSRLPTSWFAVAGGSQLVGTSKPLPGIKVINPYEVQVTLAQPNVFFVRSLTDAVYSIIPEHILKNVTAKTFAKVAFTTTDPVGTGPYTLKAVAPQQYAEFQANPAYFGGSPHIETIYFKENVQDASAVAQLQSGELQLAMDLNPNDNKTLQGVSGLTSGYHLSVANETLQFEMDNPLVNKDPRIRQAVYYAVDRRSMLKNLFGGHGTVLWTFAGLNPNTPGLNKYPFDPAKAHALLVAAHWNFKTPFRIVTSSAVDPEWGQIAPVVQQYLKNVGLNAVLVPLDAAGWTNAVLSPKPTFELTLESGGDDGLGPYASSENFACHTKSESFWYNCTADNLYAKALTILNPAKRAAVYAQVALYTNVQLPWLMLWQSDNFDAYTAKLGGTFAIYPNDRDSFFEIAGWTLSK